MYLTKLTKIHTVVGLFLALSYVTGYVVMSSMFKNIYPNHKFVDWLTDGNYVLLLAAACSNLILGSYMESKENRIANTKIFASSLILFASLGALVSFFGRMSAVSYNSVSFNATCQILLLLGVFLHSMKYSKVFNAKKHFHVNRSDTLTVSGRETGTVKWFDISKGFGFISRDHGDDVFVHYRSIRGDGHKILAEGQRVEFYATQKDKGLQADDVVSTSQYYEDA